MNEFTNEQLELFKIIDAPHTRALLTNYVSTMYEECSDLSDESLKRELIWLNDNGKLLQLFLGEALVTRAKEFDS
tara:strand:- start:243 stop:467 length:225 start_codon:yes stop_codon:yes gene_type:complete